MTKPTIPPPRPTHPNPAIQEGVWERRYRFFFITICLMAGAVIEGTIIGQIAGFWSLW